MINISSQDRTTLEAQYHTERDRSKRLAKKAEELKRKLLQLQRSNGAADKDSSMSVSLSEPATSSESDLHKQIRILQGELSQTRQITHDIAAVIRETLHNTLGDASIDVEDVRTSRVKVDMGR
jgi:small-conductance mechanosensitive channel